MKYLQSPPVRDESRLISTTVLVPQHCATGHKSTFVQGCVLFNGNNNEPVIFRVAG